MSNIDRSQLKSACYVGRGACLSATRWEPPVSLDLGRAELEAEVGYGLEIGSDVGARPTVLPAPPLGPATVAQWSELLRRARSRFARYSLGEMIAGFIFSRKLTRHGLTIVTDGRPWPKVINRGGEIHTANCPFSSAG